MIEVSLRQKKLKKTRAYNERPTKEMPPKKGPTKGVKLEKGPRPNGNYKTT